MLLEIHVHTSKYSKCSEVDPVTLVKQAQAKAMQGVVITEHQYLWLDDEIAQLRKESEISEGFVILAGQEAVTDAGHILVYGADKTIAGKISLKDLRKDFPDAALVWAHPFRDGNIPTKEQLLNPFIDAVEIFNINHTAKENYLALTLWHEYKFNAIAGSDTHKVQNVAIYPAEFNHPIFNIKNLADEIKQKRVKPFLKEIFKSGSNIAVTEIIIGTKGADEIRPRLITKKITIPHAWESAKRSISIKESLYEHGFNKGKFRVPKTIEIDEKNNLIIEESQRGGSLFDVLGYVSLKTGIEYVKLTAQWLAVFHDTAIRITDKAAAQSREMRRFDGYKDLFVKTNNPYVGQAKSIISSVKKYEDALFSLKREALFQCHGDFHPKNIIIGQDRDRDINTLFVSVIDFDSAILMPKAFDVGYFIAQFIYQFHKTPDILKEYNQELFVNFYKESAQHLHKNFDSQVEIFKARAFLSIASFLIRVGKGQGSNMKYVFLQLEKLKI